MNEQQTYEWIEAYLAGELEEAERVRLEARMADDPAFAARVKLLADMEEALSDPQARALQAQLDELGSRYFKEVASGKGGFPTSRLWLSAGAAAAVLLLFWLFWPGPQSSLKGCEECFAEYYQPYDFAQVDRASAQDSAQRAYALFQQEKYSQAVSAFQQLLKSQPENMQYRFALGCAWLEKSPDSAAKAFEAVIADGSSLYLSDARWYLGLSYLKAGQRDKAQAALAPLQAGGSYAGQLRELKKHCLP